MAQQRIEPRESGYLQTGDTYLYYRDYGDDAAPHTLQMCIRDSYSSYITTTYKDLVVYGILLLVLIFRPQGLFAGVTHTNKA